MKKFAILALILTLVTACAPATATGTIPPATLTPANEPSATPSAPRVWWQDAVFYEIFVRSYFDTNGDGIGDFNGITEKLDYIQSLGANAIWLMPINPSPTYHGYDVTNYYAVNPQYGTMEDFQKLLDEAHKRNIRIILDLVLNHTSSQIPWFEDANSSHDSPYRNWYLWSESYPNYNGPFGVAWHNGKDAYYYGVFSDTMPDLNYNNPEVTAEMYDITRYWLEDIGVDGFRLDAAKHLIEEGENQQNTPSTHEWFKGFYTEYKSINPDAYTVGEIAGAGASIAKTYTGDQMDQVFNFELANATLNSVRGEANSSIISGIKFGLQDMPSGNYATFLTNHDQDRTMSFLGGNMEKAKVAASILLTGQGTSFIYYGEEIGMTGKKPDENIRLPMQWSDAPNAGFSTALPWREPDASYLEVNVAAQEADPASLLNHYRALVKIRQDHPALRTGDIALVDTANSGLYSFLRREGSENILVLINLKGTPITDYKLSLADPLLTDGTFNPVTLFGTSQAAPLTIADGKFSDYKPVNELAPYSTYIFQIK